MQGNSGYTSIQNAITGLSYDLEYQTFTHSAIDLARTLFQIDSYKGTEARDKVVVVFSDGQPTETTYADETLATAYELKTDYGAEIYTIGTFAGADPSVITGAETASVGEKWIVTDKNEDPTIANRFMNYLSSNSSNAQEMGLNFTTKTTGIQCKISDEYQWENLGYYLTANNYQDLVQMFDSVSHSITVDVPSLDETGQLKDFLSPYFVFPDDFTSDAITLQTAACTGVDANGTYQWAAPVPLSAESGVTAEYQPETKSISVTGFDYAAQVVTETSKSDTEADFGQKLIVSFCVTPKDGFLGGNEVVSNTEASGIYTAQEELLKAFEVPYTDVSIASVPITTTDHSTYLGNAVNSGDAVTLAQSPFDGINNAYIDTELTIYWDENANGTIEETERANFETVSIPAGTITDTLAFCKALAPQANAQYLIEETLTPIYGGSQPERTEIANEFSIYLLVPSVTVQDIWVDYGVTVPLSQYCVKETSWQYATSTIFDGDAPTPTTEAPTVSLVSSPAAENDVYTATTEQTFTVQLLQWHSTDGYATTNSLTLSDDTQPCFTVHLNLCNLTLTKTVNASALAQYPQTFFFTVAQGEQSFCISMTAQEFASGSCSKAILGLYAGQSITITEDTAWAWRYGTDNLPTVALYQNVAEDGVTPLISTVAMPVGESTITVKNTLYDTYWLSTEQTVVNRFDTEEGCA